MKLKVFILMNAIAKILLHVNSMNKLRCANFFDDIKFRYNINLIHFTKFKPNPDYQSIVDDVKIF